MAGKFNRQLLLRALTGANTPVNNPADIIGGLAGAELLSNPLVQQMIQQVVQQQLQEFMDNGGPEKVIGQMMEMSEDETMALIMPFIPEDAQVVLQQFSQMTDEEFMQHVMDQMGISGGFGEMLGGGFNMTDIIQEWEAPFDVYCDCIPTEMEHGTMTRGTD